MVHLYEKDVVVKRYSDSRPQKGGGIRGNIFEFSQQSMNRLLFVCRNSGHHIQSQFLLTYHLSSPLSGEIVKKNLNHFLTRLRQEFPDLHYLWCLEFHKSGKPHVHFFSNIPSCKPYRNLLAYLWNSVTQESDKNLKFSSHPRNMMKWKMLSGKYLAKEYLAKTVQKTVPKRFRNVGRFWGCSRNMNPRFATIECGLTMPDKVFKMVVRQTSKLWERRAEKIILEKQEKKVKINTRNRHISRVLPLMKEDFLGFAQFYNWIYGNNKGRLQDQTYLPSFEYGVPF